MLIDGYTQPLSSPNTLTTGTNAALKIELNGTNASFGLQIHNASNSVIKGLVINRFSGAGIYVSGDSVGNRIEGNFIGTDPTGTLDRGNGGAGVSIYDGPTKEMVVGGTTLAARNLISGNRGGVETGGDAISGVPAEAHRIQGNYIGTDRSGTKDLGNDFDGIFLDDTEGIIVGGKTAVSRNVVSGNGAYGLEIHAKSNNAVVLGNRIGTTASGTGALGNDEGGILVIGLNNSIGDGTSAGSNTIAFNGQDGIMVSGGGGNAISRNSIFSNAGLGIDLVGGFEDAAGRTANDPGDVDSGPNRLQNTPVITSAKTVSGKTTIKGSLNSAGDVTYLVQFFSNPSGDEGRNFIGKKNVTADAFSGNASFTFSPATAVAAGQTITATATDLRGGNTSEFSAAKKVATS